MTTLMQAGLMQTQALLANGGLQMLLAVAAFVGPFLLRWMKSLKAGFDEKLAMYETLAVAVFLAVLNYVPAPEAGWVAFFVNFLPIMALGYLFAVGTLWLTGGRIAELIKPIVK